MSKSNKPEPTKKLVQRREFLGGAAEKLIRVLEVLVFGYVIACGVKLILRW